MTEHKFTDEEVIAHMLAYCGRMCGKCEVAKSICCDSCVILRIRDGVDLINRQKVEVERWQGGYMTQKQEIANLETELKAMRAEIERLKSLHELALAESRRASKKAVKEFADKIKNIVHTKAFLVDSILADYLFLDIDDALRQYLKGGEHNGGKQ